MLWYATFHYKMCDSINVALAHCPLKDQCNPNQRFC